MTKNMKKTSLFNKINLVKISALAASMSLALTACSQGSAEDAGGSDNANNESGEAQDFLTLSEEELRDKLPSSIVDSGTLRIGAAADQSPFSSMPAGEMNGIIPDLADEIGEVLDVDIEFVAGPTSSQIPALQADRIDIIWALMVATEEREEVIDFVSYMKNASAFLVPDGNPNGIQALSDLCGLRPAALRGSIQSPVLDEETQKCVDNDLEPMDIKLYEDPSAAHTAIASNNADAFLGGAVEFHELAEEVDDGNAFEVVRDEETYAASLGIGMLKTQSDLRDAVQGALMKIVDDGTYEEILSEYGAAEDAYTVEEIVVNPATSGVL